MLFMWIPVPGTMTPEPEPIDAVREAALPRSSTTEMWVVPGAPAVSDGAVSSSILRSAARRFSSE
jgi:hypothetical protein